MITSVSDFRFAVIILCRLFDCTESSTYRTTKHNHVVGGTATSLHQMGAASDLQPDDITPENLKKISQAAEKLGLWTKIYSKHVHVQIRRYHVENQN